MTCQNLLIGFIEKFRRVLVFIATISRQRSPSRAQKIVLSRANNFLSWALFWWMSNPMFLRHFLISMWDVWLPFNNRLIAYNNLNLCTILHKCMMIFLTYLLIVQNKMLEKTKNSHFFNFKGKTWFLSRH